MGSHETFEAPRAIESKENQLPNLSSYFMMESPVKLNQYQNRADVVITDQDVKDRVKDLHLLDNTRTGDAQNGKQLKDAGVNVKHSSDNNNTYTVTSEFPSGVVVKTVDHVTPKEESAWVSIDAKAPAHKDKDGNVVDKQGRILAKQNGDGSVTVDGGNGNYYTQYPDGSIRKDKATRSPDGKTFDVVDTRQQDAEELVRTKFYHLKK
jgi:hypothetical protein